MIWCLIQNDIYWIWRANTINVQQLFKYRRCFILFMFLSVIHWQIDCNKNHVDISYEWKQRRNINTFYQTCFDTKYFHCSQKHQNVSHHSWRMKRFKPIIKTKSNLILSNRKQMKYIVWQKRETEATIIWNGITESFSHPHKYICKDI